MGDQAVAVTAGESMWRVIIDKHGIDRCPSVIGQAHKAAEEVVELCQALEDARVAGRSQETDEHVPKELGDAGLALHGVAAKLGVSLLGAMRAVVDNETRRFV